VDQKPQISYAGKNLKVNFYRCTVNSAHNTHAATSPKIYNDVILPSVLT